MMIEHAYNNLELPSVSGNDPGSLTWDGAKVVQVELDDEHEYKDFLQMVIALVQHELSPTWSGCIITNLEHDIRRRASIYVKAKQTHLTTECTDVMLIGRFNEAKILIEMGASDVYQLVYKPY